MQEKRISGLRGALDEIVTRQERQVLALEREDDPNGVIYRRVRERILQLDKRRQRIQQELEDWAATHQDEVGDPILLDDLPVAEKGLSRLPEHLLLALLEAGRLSLKVNKLSEKVLLEMMIDETATLEFPPDCHQCCPDSVPVSGFVFGSYAAPFLLGLPLG